MDGEGGEWQAVTRMVKVARRSGFIFTRAPSSSAYNSIERQMAPLSNMTASVVLLLNTFGSLLNSANKTTDKELHKLWIH